MREEAPGLLPAAAHPQSTIGIDFLSKTMYLEDRTVRLQLWCVRAGVGLVLGASIRVLHSPPWSR